MFAVSLASDTSSNGKKKNQVSIIDMANAAYSMTSAPTSSSETNRSRNNSTSSTATLDERLDAARAMLGISPCSVADSRMGLTSMMSSRGGAIGNGNGKPRLSRASRSGSGNGNGIVAGHSQRQQQPQPLLRFRDIKEEPLKGSSVTRIVSDDTNSTSTSGRRSRSNSAGLEALAFLATREQEASTMTLPGPAATTAAAAATPSNEHLTVPFSGVPVVPNPAVTSSDDDDSEIMPPPPPRSTNTNTTNTVVNIRRRRSVSNPEGMGDKWGLPSTSTPVRRLRLVLPTSILEEEMAEANAAVIAKEKSTASASALAASLIRSDAANHHRIMNMHRVKLPKLVEEETEDDEVDANEQQQQQQHSEEEEEDEENLDHEELLRRARSRLLEDLSQSNLSGEKGVLTLPHSLRKYKEVYNKNGRIGIYTPAERAAIIARFQSKRTRRVWNKKIRYNCRKNLADRRLRVKGRFVKRSVTEAAAAAATATGEPPKPVGGAAANDKTPKTVAAAAAVSKAVPSSSVSGNAEVSRDTEMPDVSDPDAGFCPTDDQPYRRLRRHTIT